MSNLAEQFNNLTPFQQSQGVLAQASTSREMKKSKDKSLWRNSFLKTYSRVSNVY